MRIEVAQALLQSFNIGFADIGQRHKTMPLERLGGSDKHNGRRREAGGAALDVDEFFCAQITAEAGLRDGPVTQGHGSLRGNDRVAAVSDVGKGAAVNKGKIAFERLHEVGLHGFKKQRHESARSAQFFAGESGAVALDADHQTIDAGAQIVKVGCQAEHCHQFTGYRDVKTGFRRNAVCRAAETGDNVAKHAVIDVEHAAPNDGLQIDLALMAGVVDHGGQQVVGGCDGVEVTGEVQVDGFHREHLRVTAAGGTALHAEARSQRRFAKRDHSLFA